MREIEIPGPFEKNRTFNVPPVKVIIPLIASGNFKKSFLFFVVSSLSSALGLAITIIVIWVSIAGEHSRGLLRGTPAILVCAASVFALGIIAARHAQLLRHSKNVLTIDCSGVRDLRQNVFVEWGNVAHISSIRDKKGIAGTSLHLRQKIMPDLPSVRLGMQWLFIADRNKIEISIKNLDERPYILIHAMGALVRQHGGTSDISQWGWKRGW